MILMILSFVRTLAVFEKYASYEFAVSSSDTKFEVVKGVSTEALFCMIRMGEWPYLNFDTNKNSWDFSSDFFDLQGWVENSNSLMLSVPGNISGIAYLGIYSENEQPDYYIKLTTKSSSSCLKPCQNGGVCISGTCQCLINYGGYSCEIELKKIFTDTKYTIDLPSYQWNYFRVETKKYLKIIGVSESTADFQLFINTETSTFQLPNMIDSQGIYFETNGKHFEGHFNHAETSVRIGIFCFASDQCQGTIEINEIQTQDVLWIIIFCSVLGFFIVTSIPLAIICCRKRIEIKKKKNIQLNKQQMEVLFPLKEFDGDSKEICTICLEVLANHKMCRRLPCDHYFHDECIDEWANSNLHCPICKQNVLVGYGKGNFGEIFKEFLNGEQEVKIEEEEEKEGENEVEICYSSRCNEKCENHGDRIHSVNDKIHTNS